MIVVAAPGFLDLPHHLERRGRHKGISYPIASDQVKCFLRVEFPGTMGKHWNAMMQAGEEGIDEPSYPSPIRRGPEEIILSGEEIMGKFNPRKVSQ
jgi:hypothetical protein